MNPGDTLLTRLQAEHLKPAGFKKQGRTFSRAHAGYAEHFNLQGSQWNAEDAPWVFYVNVAISFPDLPVKRPGAGLWKYHAHTRLRDLVPKAPMQYEVTAETLEKVVARVSRDVLAGAAYFERRHATLRASYMADRWHEGFLWDGARG